MPMPRFLTATELPRSRIGWALAIGAWWIATAALTGLLHGAELLVARHGFGQLVWFSREFVWMSPIAYALVMAPGAAILVCLAMIASRTWALAIAAAAFATVGTFGLLLPYSEVARPSSLILALGVGITIGRAVHAKPLRWLQRARRMAIAAVTAIVIVAPAQRGYFRLAEARAIASLPAGERGTNVVLVILDTVRAASMGLYSAIESTTPRLNEWSATSTVFDWAFSPSSWTLPSHAAMFTGAWPSQQSGDWEVPLDRSLPTLAERLRDRGYVTGAFVANMHYTAWDSGLRRGFTRYDGYLVNWRQLMLSSSFTQTRMYAQLLNARTWGERFNALLEPNLSIDSKHRFAFKRGQIVTDDFLDWQASHDDRPFFAFLNYYDAHQPYYAPDEYRHFAGDRGLGMYRASIAYLDAELDRLLRTLQERGVLDNTLIVITSDHGELFGFRGLTGHAHNLYLNTIRVPLLLRLPGSVPEGRRITQPVTLRDLAATVMDLAAPGARSLPGSSLRGTWSGAPVSPVLVEVKSAPNIDPRLPTARGDLQSLINNRYQYIRNAGDGREELFAYRAGVAQPAQSPSDTVALLAMRRQVLDLLRIRR